MYEMSAEAQQLRSAQARAAGLQSAAFRDNVAQGHIGQRGLTAKFYAMVDARFPNATPADREKRMRLLLSAHMVRIRSERTRKAIRRAARSRAAI